LAELLHEALGSLLHDRRLIERQYAYQRTLVGCHAALPNAFERAQTISVRIPPLVDSSTSS
jgi:hypothetical protein